MPLIHTTLSQCLFNDVRDLGVMVERLARRLDREWRLLHNLVGSSQCRNVLVMIPARLALVETA